MPQYALGPWQWLTMEDLEAGRGGGWSYWGPPSGTIASVDLRPLADRERRTLGDRPYGLFLFPDGIRIPSEYQSLATDTVSRDAWLSLLGYRPEGDTVERCLYDMILHGDPSDADRIKPLLPTTRGNLDLHLGGLAIREQFRYGVHQHTSVVRDMVRREIRAQYEYDAARGDITLTRKVLDYELAKYRITTDQWRELVPNDLQDAIQGPLPRTTTIADNFNRDNGNIENEPSSDGDWSWANIENTLQVNSNVAIQNISNTDGAARAEKDLSGSDQRVTIEVAAFGSNSSAYVGPLARLSSSAYTGYACRRLGTSASNHLRLYSVSSGTPTQIDASASQPTIVGIEVDSNSISSYNNTTLVNTVTDMAVSSGVRTGINIRPGGIATAFAGDNFAAEDLEAGAAEGSGSVIGVGLLTGAGTATEGSGDVVGIGVISGEGQATEGSGDVVGVGIIVGAGPVSEGSGSLIGIGVLQGAGESNEGSGSIIGIGVLEGSGSATEGSGSVIGIGVIEGTGDVPTGDGEGAGSVVGIGVITGAGAGSEGSGDVSAIGVISGTGDATEGSGSVSAIGLITGEGFASEGSGSIIGIGVLTGAGEEVVVPLPDPVPVIDAVADMMEWWVVYVQMSMSESSAAAGAAAGIEYRSPSSRLEYRAASTRICYRVPRTARI